MTVATRRARRRCAALAVVGVIVLAAAQAARPSDAEAGDDVAALLKASQLEVWLEESVPLGTSLCIQATLGSAWPWAAGALDERDADHVRLVREQCGRVGSGKRGLLAGARRDFTERVIRLQGLQEAVRRCEARYADSDARAVCLQSAAGIPLDGPTQQRLLLASRGAPDPAASRSAATPASAP